MLHFMSLRLLRAIVTMFVVLVLAFVMLRLSGEPFDAMFPEGITQEHRDALAREWKIDLPIFDQFVLYLGNLATGDFGRSLFTREKVWDMYATRLPPTLMFGGLALLIAICVGIPLGALAALRRGTHAG